MFTHRSFVFHLYSTFREHMRKQIILVGGLKNLNPMISILNKSVLLYVCKYWARKDLVNSNVSNLHTLHVLMIWATVGLWRVAIKVKILKFACWICSEVVQYTVKKCTNTLKTDMDNMYVDLPAPICDWMSTVYKSISQVKPSQVVKRFCILPQMALWWTEAGQAGQVRRTN